MIVVRRKRLIITAILVWPVCLVVIVPDIRMIQCWAILTRVTTGHVSFNGALQILIRAEVPVWLVHPGPLHRQVPPVPATVKPRVHSMGIVVDQETIAITELVVQTPVKLVSQMLHVSAVLMTTVPVYLIGLGLLV